MSEKKTLALALGFLLVLGACAGRRGARPAAGPAGQSEFDRHLNEGIRLSLRGDNEGAVREFTVAQSLNPRSARAHNLCGIAYFHQQNYSAAETQFLRAIDIDGSDADAYNNLGSVYFARHEYQRAEKMYRKVLDLSPASVSPYYSLGTLLLIQGRADEGTRYLAKGIQLDPQFLATHGSLTVDVPTPGSEWSETYFVYAKLFARNGRPQEAFEFLRKARKAGFHEWKRIMEDDDFKALRQNPQIKEFLPDKPSASPQGSRP